MATTEKHHYIPHEDLKEKYKNFFDRIKAYSKAIGSATRTNINVELKGCNTIQFVIIGGKSSVDKALRHIQDEFEKGRVKQSRAETVFLTEKKHKNLIADKMKFPSSHETPLLTEEALRKHDIQTGAYELRQFGCLPCNHPWWSMVLRSKPVSTCHLCQVKYDALERCKEYGIGRYICIPCNNVFYARCEATEENVCHGCMKLIGPPYISPRFKPHPRPYPYYSRDYTSPRPSYLKVIHASTPHDSTGSTVGTFLTQDLGADIYVELDQFNAMADNYKGDTDSASATSEEDDRVSTVSEVSDSTFPTSDFAGYSSSDSEAGGNHVFRRRIAPSDSEDDPDPPLNR